MKRNIAFLAFACAMLSLLSVKGEAQTFGSLRPLPVGNGYATSGAINPWLGDIFGNGCIVGPVAVGSSLTGYWPVAIGGIDASGNVQFVPLGTFNQQRVQSEAAGKSITLLASTTDAVAHTVSNAATVTGLGIYREADIFLNVTAAAAAAGDTLDVYIDTTADGTNYVNAVHFTQVLGNGGAKSFWATLSPQANVSTSVVDTTADAAAGTVRPVVFTDRLRVRYVIVDGGAHGQSFTFALTGYFR